MKDLPKINLHIHSNFSDGINSIPQIVKKSTKLGLKYISITDHFTNSWKSNIIPNLDTIDKLEDYFKQISLCQEFLNYKKIDLTILKGVEIDIQSSQSHILKYINPMKFDIILFEYLENPEGIAFIKILLDNWIKSRKVNNNFSVFGLAHFDPSYFIYGNLNMLIKFLNKYEIFFEFNSSYSHCYSRKNELFFQELKNSKINVSIGTDSHHLMDLGKLEEPLEMVFYYNLEDNLQNLIHKLEMRKDRI
ncbi:MAG: PHP domain-containing protein [Candidatus Hodarchaeota archaeon]